MPRLLLVLGLAWALAPSIDCSTYAGPKVSLYVGEASGEVWSWRQDGSAWAVLAWQVQPDDCITNVVENGWIMTTMQICNATTCWSTRRALPEDRPSLRCRRYVEASR